MLKVTIWILLVTSGSQGGVMHVTQYADKVECDTAAQQVEQLSRDKRGMPNLYAICVPSRK